MKSGTPVLAILEATSVTGPAKNLLEFARIARDLEAPFLVEICRFQRPGDPQLLDAAARDAGVTVHTIPERGRFDRSIMPALIELVQKRRPALVQTHAVKAHFLARKTGLFLGRPWIAFHHGYTWPDWRARMYNQLDRWSLREADRVITVSQSFREQLVSRGIPAKRIEVIHNAIAQGWGSSDPVDAAKFRANLGLKPDTDIVLSVGRLSREKDHATLLEAMKMLTKTGSRAVELLIVGDGPERSAIEQRIREFGLIKNIRLTGQVPSAEPYYAIASIAVIHSRSEGSPNALLEAMAAGVPLVATAVGGVPEMVTDRESALLIEPGDASKLAAAVHAVLDDRKLASKLAARARDLAVTRHSPLARAEEVVRIYRAVLAEHKASA